MHPRNVVMVGDHLHDIQCGKDAGSGTHSYSNTVEPSYTDTKGQIAIVSILSRLSEKNVLAQTHFLLILRYNGAVIEAESQGSEARVFK